jgi:hypothetical protein
MFFVAQNYLLMANLLFFLPELFMYIIPTNSGHIYILVARRMHRTTKNKHHIYVMARPGCFSRQSNKETKKQITDGKRNNSVHYVRLVSTVHPLDLI